jgi:hypothetical protein
LRRPSSERTRRRFKNKRSGEQSILTSARKRRRQRSERARKKTRPSVRELESLEKGESSRVASCLDLT